ncbi:hypothetical protein Agub_g3502, partial [Astrephomene gubernaculifera]
TNYKEASQVELSPSIYFYPLLLLIRTRLYLLALLYLVPSNPTETMSAQGTALQNHNNELVKCIEDLREKREEIIKQLREDDAEKAKITQDLQILTKRLAQVNESIARKTETKNEYDKVISETEAAYLKILESSQTLLTVLKREAVNIAKKKQASS